MHRRPSDEILGGLLFKRVMDEYDVEDEQAKQF
jgi:hypothetical protein